MIIAAASDAPAVWTAVGTIVLAALTFAAVVTAIIITRQDRNRASKQRKEDRDEAARLLADERKYAAGVLAAERQAADDRLARQLKATSDQLWEERGHRVIAQQLSDAWAVRVLMTREPPDPDEDARLIAVVTNLGSRTISDLRAQFSPDGTSRIGVFRTEHVPRPTDPAVPFNPDTIRALGVLPPGAGVQFSSEVIDAARLTGADVIVRWRDFYDNTWQFKSGKVSTTPITYAEQQDW